MIARALFAPALMLGLAPNAARAEPGLTSPMVNTAIYREGEVRRLTGHYADWSVVCDEIASLKQRYCSLRSTVQGGPGQGGLAFDVSTGDNGRPAALLHLPLAISLAFGVDIAADEPADEARGRTKSVARKNGAAKLSIATCDERECLAAWSLSPSSIAALNAGNGLRLVYCSMRSLPMEFSADLGGRSCQTKATALLSGRGFGEAIRASIN